MQEFLVNYQRAHVFQHQGPVLQNLDVQIQRGEFIYLVGKSGSGKTSFLHSLIGLNSVKGDIVQVLGFDLLKIKRKNIPTLRKQIGVVFQDFGLLPYMHAYGNLEFVLQATGWKDKKEMKHRIEEVMAECGILSKAYQMPHALSGGEQQKLAISRSLLNNPALILADEPTGNLDPESSEEVLQIFYKVNRMHATSVVLATHDYRTIEKYSARVLHCSDHCIRESAMSQLV